ncbi:AP-4 complex accessory subunit RUSC2 isoform X1 [Dendrobates tinctorius]|uniref:AP-4 complex accessory subunit RUSC2 isoform X1 n=2 Tax=Dendrobates tinctorius TaxID=92724 RepID=UPI003CCA14A5
MDSPPKLAGETLIVHHIPLVHCQVPDRQCCPPSTRSHSYRKNDLGITRTTSLPERDLSQADSLVYSSLIQTSEPSEKEKGKKGEDWQGPVTRKRHNPFLPNDEDESNTSSGSEGEKSFHLHDTLGGVKTGFQFQDLSLPPFHLHDNPPVVKPWILTGRPGLLDGLEEKTSTDDLQKGTNGNPGSSIIEDQSWNHGGPSFTLDWNQSSDLGNQDFLQSSQSRECTCNGSESLRHCRCYSASSQSEMDQQVSYVSDSSCNSSDGILVNFSTLYNKMNGQPRSNLNSGSLSCDSSFCSHPDTGAFYLDLQNSPTESKMSCDSHVHEASSKPCGCHHHSSSPELDANCNSYHLNCDSVQCNGESSELTSCFQSQARLVVATQNYYKLVTCDLSSQSSPSPAGSSITSCSDDHTKGSPVQPTEYFLFQQPESSSDTNDPKPLIERSKSDTIEGQVYVNVSPPNFNTGRQRSRSYDRSLDKSPSNCLGSLERMMSCPVKLSEGQVVHTQGSSPKRVTSFLELAKCRRKEQKNGSSPPLKSSGDSSLEFSPIPEYHRDGGRAYEHGEFRSHSLPPMSFLHCMSRTCEGCTSDNVDTKATATKAAASTNQTGPPTEASIDQTLRCNGLDAASSGLNFLQKNPRVKGDGMGAEAKPVFRYSKDQRPTTLPIQPFVFQHHFSKPKTRPLHSHFTSSLSQLYGLSSNRSSTQHNVSESQSSAPGTLAGQMEVNGGHRMINVPGKLSLDGLATIGDEENARQAPETTRPSPLGSYSPIRSNAAFFQSMDSGSSSSPSPEKVKENQPPRSRSCPAAANLLPLRATQVRGTTLPGAAKPTRKYDGSPKIEIQRPLVKREPLKEPSTQVSKHGLPPINSLPLLNTVLHETTLPSQNEEDKPKRVPENIMISRPVNANHLSPQALKWREYRRRNPLGLERVHGLPVLSGSLDRRQETKIVRRNHFFDFPGSINGNHLRLNGKPSALISSDFFPDYFSVTERPPAEFCLSPDSSVESVSIDLMQKRGLVKAVNTAVDLVVAHFGTSRDPGVKAKLGNSSVSPNIGHLILKYLCPAIRDILSDGLKPCVLDVIIGQRRNLPWTVVEASTQLGPSTKLLHNLCQKVNQYSELSNHNLRFNAFIFGLLNIRSLEFWFNHLYNHEDIVWAHYDPVGFLSVSHGVCQPLFEELLLLLQPLSLLPFDLDLLFEHHLVQMRREQQQKKEMLRVKQDLMQSVHSTIQLMRSRDEEEQMSQEKKSLEKTSSEESSSSERPTGEGAAAVEFDEEHKKGSTMEVKRDKQAGWWYQLMQSSQVYIENSSDTTRFTRQDRRRPGNGGTPKKVPPPREGVIDGAEACPCVEGTVEDKTCKKEMGDETQKDNRKSWMGSPPESVLNELKRGREKETGDSQKTTQTGGQEQGAAKENAQSSPARKWGHLFGSRRTMSEGKPTNRPPSGWLSLDKSVFQMVAQTVSAGIWGEVTSEKESIAAERGASSVSPSSQNQPQASSSCYHPEPKQNDIRFAYETHSDQLCGRLRNRNPLMPLKFVPQPDRIDS